VLTVKRGGIDISYREGNCSCKRKGGICIKAQITLNVAEGKRINAEGIVALPKVKRALRGAKSF